MNAKDRKQVAALVSRLGELQSQFESAKSEIGELADAEQEKFDNLSEGLQQGEKGQAIEEAAGHLQEAADAESIEESVAALENLP